MQAYLRLAGMIWVLTTMPALAENSACVRPGVEQFLERSRRAIGFKGEYFPGPVEAVFLPPQSTEQRIQWMGTSWWAPREGALFVLNCAGVRLASLRLGAVVRMARGPTLPKVGPTVEVVYISGYGSGELVTEVKLFAFQNKKIVELWTHQDGEQAGGAPVAEYADTYTWKFSAAGTVIWVHGKREMGSIPDDEHGWDAYTTHEFPSEAWCWRPTYKRYLACDNDSQR
jgi:hypothetical protein